MNELDVNLLEIFNYLPANVYLKDTQGKFTWCNANQLKVLGLSHLYEIVGKTDYDLAEELHALGYTKLILVSGEDPKGRAPEYLQVVRKKDGEDTENLNKV